MQDVLYKKDPFRRKQCERPDCFVCRSRDKRKEICNKVNIKYSTEWTEKCNGETLYSTYTKGKEHLEKYNQQGHYISNTQSLHE